MQFQICKVEDYIEALLQSKSGKVLLCLCETVERITYYQGHIKEERACNSYMSIVQTWADECA